MVKQYVVVVVSLLVMVTGPLLFQAELATGEETDFLNEWVAEVDGDLDQVTSIVERHGFELVGEMPYIENHYILRHVDVPQRSKRSAHHHTSRLAEDSDVKWAEQQFARRRVKRGYVEELRNGRFANIDQNQSCHAPGPLLFDDPKFPCQWYMAGDDSSRKYLTNVQDVWRMNITGRDVVVSVVDDGLETNHSDLFANYDPCASTDVNGNDSDPTPRYEKTNENKHGTRCAGEIAMMANNSVCGVGIAFNCKIGGIRLLDGNITDAAEALALSFNYSHVDVYSLSWGPTDDGKTLDKPHRLSQKAMEIGVEKGRGGKGVIYTLASGNGGGSADNCNCDGYASSMYTISVSSAAWDGKKPGYGECCASSLTTTYSSGGGKRIGVVSTDLHDGCTLHHSGTSASAPLASGIIALALEANGNLTWRDVQHLVAITSKPEQLDPCGWYKNAAGFCVNPSFGFGLMDPLDMVTRAKTWVNVPERRSCNVTSVAKTKEGRSMKLPRIVDNGSKAEVTFDVDSGCCQNKSTEIRYLEHVQFVFSMNYTRRGAVSVYAISPNGTETCVLDPRYQDNSTDNFKDWPLMSVHTWGEDPCGTWTFRVEDGSEQEENSGSLLDVRLILHGTLTAPAYRSDSSVYCNMTLNTTGLKCDDKIKTGPKKPTVPGKNWNTTKVNDTSSNDAKVTGQEDSPTDSGQADKEESKTKEGNPEDTAVMTLKR